MAKKKEAALPVLEKGIHTVVESIRDPVFIHDKAGNILYANKAYLKYAQAPIEAVLGKPYWTIFPEINSPLGTCSDEDVASDWSMSDILMSDHRTLRDRSFSMRDTNDQYLYSVHIIEDVSELVDLQNQLAVSEEKFRAIGMSAQDGVVLMGGHGEIVFWNKAATQILGYEVEEVMGKDIHHLLAPIKYRSAYLKGLKTFFDTGKGPVVSAVNRLEAIRKDCTVIPIELSVSATEIRGVWHAVGIFRDITDRKEFESRLMMSQAIIETAGEAIFVTDREGVIIDANPAFTTITGYKKEEVLGKRPDILKSGRHGKKFYQAIWHALLTEGKWQGEIWNRRKSGEIYPEWLTITCISDVNGEVKEFIGIFTDISDRKVEENKIKQEASSDPLTGLPNLRSFRARVDQVITLCDRYQKRAALLYFDLDYFKKINDQHGHLLGDALLEALSPRLMNVIRKSDTVARLGGDEFAILLYDVQHHSDVEKIAQKLLASLSEPFELKVGPVQISASIGIALYPADADSAQDWIHRADVAMYWVKQHDRNNHHFWTKRDGSVVPEQHPE